MNAAGGRRPTTFTADFMNGIVSQAQCELPRLLETSPPAGAARYLKRCRAGGFSPRGRGASPPLFNLSHVNHSLLLFVHVAKTAGSTTRRQLHRFAARTSAIPCVEGLRQDCDRTSAWKRRHLFLSFHDGRRTFGPKLVALLPKLREKYAASVR